MSYPTPNTQSFGVRDASLASNDALPAAASTTVNGTAIDLGEITCHGARLEACEALLSAPALSNTVLPNTKTMTYSIEGSELANFASKSTLAGSCIVQTGDGTGNAAAATTCRYKLPSNCPRYIRAVAVSGANTTNAAALEMTLELLF